MIFDNQGIFSDDQDLAGAGSVASTNYINLGAPGTPYGAAAALEADMGKGNRIPIAILVTEAFTTLDSLKVAVQVDDNTSFSSATTVIESETYAPAALVAGFKFPIIYVPIKTNERYLRLYYTIAGSNPGAGMITAGVIGGHDEAWNS